MARVIEWTSIERRDTYQLLLESRKGVLNLLSDGWEHGFGLLERFAL